MQARSSRPCLCLPIPHNWRETPRRSLASRLATPKVEKSIKQVGGKVLLFGAGASHGAGHVLPFEPPLGREAYDRLADAYPREWGPGSLLARFASQFRGQGFEKTMFEEVFGWIPTWDVLLAQRAMALYFARFSPDPTGNDLYSRLVQRLRETDELGRITFASLNYDCVLEQAATQLGLRVDYSGNTPDSGTVAVLKPHGSCNFITTDVAPYRAQLAARGFFLDCGMDYLPSTGLESLLASTFAQTRACYFPVLSLYASYRNSLVSDRRIQEIRNQWSNRVSEASVIGIVGVRPNPDDPYIWEAMRSTPARPAFIGARSDFEGWSSANRRFEFLGNTFEEGFENLIATLLAA